VKRTRNPPKSVRVKVVSRKIFLLELHPFFTWFGYKYIKAESAKGSRRFSNSWAEKKHRRQRRQLSRRLDGTDERMKAVMQRFGRHLQHMTS
jgi:hypothetical protein